MCTRNGVCARVSCKAARATRQSRLASQGPRQAAGHVAAALRAKARGLLAAGHAAKPRHVAAKPRMFLFYFHLTVVHSLLHHKAAQCRSYHRKLEETVTDIITRHCLGTGSAADSCDWTHLRS